MNLFKKGLPANVIEAPEVREILTRLGQAREQHSAIVTEKMGADSEVSRVESEIGQAITQQGIKEKAVAISGALPDDAFPEEAQIARLGRQRRVLLARVLVMQERVTASQKTIDDLKKQLESAWLKVGVERCQELGAAFRQAALALRKVQCDHIAWMQCFSNQPGVPGLGTALVMDPYGKTGNVIEPDGCMTMDGHLVDSRHALLTETYWEPVSGTLADAIRALHDEVEAAKGE